MRIKKSAIGYVIPAYPIADLHMGSLYVALPAHVLVVYDGACDNTNLLL
jgi:hypothetical protein